MHSRQENEAVASERSIFSENHDYKSFFPCRNEHVRGIDARGGRKLRTDTQDYSNPCCAHARRGLINGC